MHIGSQNNRLEKEDKIAGVVDPICAKKPLLCPLTVSGSGPGAYFQSKLLEILAQVDPGPLAPTERNLGERLILYQFIANS